LKHVCSVICSTGLCIAFLATAAATNALSQTGNAGPQTSSQTVSPGDPKTAKTASRALRKAVILQLSRTRGLSVDGINVIAVDGVVALVGTAPDTHQIDLATDAAKSVTGVREVRNSLTLQTNGK
jgi:hyperosmotically inducible protein